MTKLEPGAAPLGALIMDSKSDWTTMQRAAEVLAELGVPYESKIVSAHRTPDLLFEYVGSGSARHPSHHRRRGRRGPSPGHGGGQDDSAGARCPRAVQRASGLGFALVHRADAQGGSGRDSRNRRGWSGECRIAGNGRYRARRLARDLDGNVRFHPIAENTQRRHILHTSRVPARIPLELVSQAEKLGARIASALGHVGLFVTRNGGLPVNEITPRTHNSGHYSFGACATSQFEQHVRAICGLPLGDPSLLRPSVMLNLLGDLWRDGPPAWRTVLSHPTARLHLYGKRRPSPGRKMGHIVILDEDIQNADEVAATIATELEQSVPALPVGRAWT